MGPTDRAAHGKVLLSTVRRRVTTMQLYYMKGACSLASYISLNEAGVKFDAVEIDHKTHKSRTGEDLSKINGKNYVPVLRLDNGEILTENVAVLSYIGDLNPDAKLAPPRSEEHTSELQSQ